MLFLLRSQQQSVIRSSVNMKRDSSLSSISNSEIDARVMLLTNMNIADKLVHGQFGTVRGCCYYQSSYQIECIYYKCDDESVRLSQKVLNNEEYENCVQIQRCDSEIPFRGSDKMTRTQSSLDVASDCTVRKVQGMTLPRTVVSLELLNQKII